MNKLNDIETEQAVSVAVLDDLDLEAALAVKQQDKKDAAEKLAALEKEAAIAQRHADIAQLDADFHSLSANDTLEDVKALCERMAALQVPDAERLIYYDLVKQSKISGATKSAAKTFHNSALAAKMNAKREAGETREVSHLHWTDYLLRSIDGNVLANEANIIRAIQSAPELQDFLYFEEFMGTINIAKIPPWGDSKIDDPSEWKVRTWTENDTTLFVAWLQRNGINAHRSIVFHTVAAMATNDTRNCRKAYLEPLEWDGIPRLDIWLTMYLGVGHSLFTSKAGRWWWISMVARTYAPGCKVDHLINFEGDQGMDKSKMLRLIAGGDKHFYDLSGDIDDKDTWLAMQGAVITEIAELASMRKSQVENFKAFVTRQIDKFRAPYDRIVGDHLRQGVLAGTSNLTTEYLVDPSGNRRIWPAKVIKIQFEALRRDLDQLWAEAKALYDNGARWHPDRDLDAEFIAQAKIETDKRMEKHILTEPVHAYLYNSETAEWKTDISTYQILTLLGYEAKSMKPADKTAIAGIMQQLGYEQGWRYVSKSEMHDTSKRAWFKK